MLLLKFVVILLFLQLNLSAFGDVAEGGVEGTILADTIVIGSTNITSDRDLTYDDGTGDQTATTTSDYSVFSSNGATPITVDGREGDDMIGVSGFGAVGINIKGGMGANTISVPSGAILNGYIDGGSETSSNTITINGTVLSDVGHGNVQAVSTDDGILILGAIGYVDGAEAHAHNVTLDNVTVANINGQDNGILATGLITVANSSISGTIDNRSSLDESGIIIDGAGDANILSSGEIEVRRGGAGRISNVESSSQASITVFQAGGGAIQSRGAIEVIEAGAGLVENVQLVPDTDNPGIILGLGGGGDLSSDGRVLIQSGGAGRVASTDAVISGTATATSIVGRDLSVLNNVDKVTLGAGASVGNATLGGGDDSLTVFDLNDLTVTGSIDGGNGSDTFTAFAFDISVLTVFYQDSSVVFYEPSGGLTEGIEVLNIALFEMYDASASLSDADIYGNLLAAIFFDTEFSGPLDSLSVLINGVSASESDLENYALPTDGSETVFTFMGNNPVSGETMEFEITAAVPEPAETVVLFALLIGLLTTLRQIKAIAQRKENRQ